MTDEEKDLLRRIPLMRLDKEIDKVLDRIYWLDKLEEELNKKK